jgi:CheY-like chemotaxis protein
VTRTALVVDDEALIRRLVRTVLEADDYAVLEAADADEAFAVLADGQPHPSVVVLDVMMPGMGGLEVCRRLNHDDVKVVMERRCREAGAEAFLTKPFSSIELLDVLETLAK